MTSNPLWRRKTLLAGPALVATTTTLMVGLTGLTSVANAAPGDAVAVTGNKTQTVQIPDSASNISGTATVGSGEALKYEIISGPDADSGNNGNNADGTIAVTSGTWTFDPVDSDTAGTDTYRFWVDANADNVFQSGEANDTATITWVGPAFSVNLAPDTEGASQNSCAAFSVSSADNHNPPQNNLSQTIDITASQTGATTVVSQCDPETGDIVTAGTAGTPLHFEVTTGDDGSPATFGIESDTVGTVNIRAFVDENDDNTFQAGEPTDTSTLTVSAGNGADSASSLSAAPTTQDVFPGDTVTVKVTVKNSAGDTLAGVPVQEQRTGANPGTDVATTNAHGVATFTYTATNNGTDNLTFWVNQTTGGTAGPDASEPKTTATVHVAAATQATDLDISCTEYDGSDSTFCELPLDHPSDTITATATKADGPDAGTDPDPVAGVPVRFFISASGSTGADDRIGPDTASCTTGADGTCEITVTDTGAKDGDQAYVTAQAPGTSGTLNDDQDGVTVEWQARAASNIDLVPDTLTKHVGGTASFTATVEDQFGDPITNDTVQADVTGRNTKTLTATTNGSGKATFSYTDTGNQSAEGTDTVTATADTDQTTAGFQQSEFSDSSTVHWILGSDTVSKIQLAVDYNSPDFNNPTVNKSTSGDIVEYSNDNSDFEELQYECFVYGYPPACAALAAQGNGAIIDTAYPYANYDRVEVRVANSDGTPLAGAPVTLTTSVPGIITDWEWCDINDCYGFPSADELSSSDTDLSDSNGYVDFYVWSSATGTQNLTATAVGGASDTGSETWNNEVWDARNIDIVGNPNPQTGTAENLTAVVRDRFGNGVANVDLSYSSSGVGSLDASGGTTGGNGTASIPIHTTNGTTGDQTVTATIKSTQSTGAQHTLYYDFEPLNADTQCGLGDGDPMGNFWDDEFFHDTAGNCSDQGTVHWQAAAPPVDQTRPHIGSPATRAIQLGAHRHRISGSAADGHDLALYKDGKKIATGVADSSGHFSFTPMVSKRSVFYVLDTDNNKASNTVTILVKVRITLTCTSPQAHHLRCTLDTNPTLKGATVDYKVTYANSTKTYTFGGTTNKHGNDVLAQGGLKAGKVTVTATVHGKSGVRGNKRSDDTKIKS